MDKFTLLKIIIPIIANNELSLSKYISLKSINEVMDKRVDTFLVIKNVVFVIKFKVGKSHFLNHHIKQVWDYVLVRHNVKDFPLLADLYSTKSNRFGIYNS